MAPPGWPAGMAGPERCLVFPGTVRQALTFHHGVFGGELAVDTFGDFGRDAGPADGIAHGVLDGPVSLFGADAIGGEAFRSAGPLFSPPGRTSPAGLRSCFDDPADSGSVLDALQERPWGAVDAQVVDRHGIRRPIGFEST